MGIRQSVLMDALTKGSVAAISKDAQIDTSNLALLIQSTKIIADEKTFTVESNTDRMSVKYSIPVTEEGGVIVKEAGSLLVPASELIKWVKAQGSDSTINISLNKLATPEIINTLDDIDVSDSADKFMIKKIGSAILISKDDKKVSSKWKLDCYDPDQVKPVVFSSKTPKSFNMGGEYLEIALANVLVATLDKDYEHVLDSISIQTHEKSLYFAATDTKRCALYRIPPEGVSDIESETPMLIQAALLDIISKIIDKEIPLTFAYDEETRKVFITQKNLKIRLASTDKNVIDKFPNIKMLLEKEYKSLTSISRGSLMKVLITASLVNSDSALFSFSKEKETLTVKTISEDNKYDPNISNCIAPKVAKDVNAVWGVTWLMDGLKIIKDDEINICIPDNFKSVKFIGNDGKSLMYFSMSIDNPKYALEKE
jgi:DNA polymerase III sliding clamp (beta) subunit (PCNA family)